MCMKEYGCCPKFGRGDNLTYTLEMGDFQKNEDFSFYENNLNIK